MKMKNRLRALLLLVIALNLSACGFTASSLRHKPGYADLDYPAFWEADKDVSISIGPTPLKFALWAAEGDEDLEFLRCFRGVRVKTYHVDGFQDRIADKIQRTKTALGAEGWQEIISIREANERVVVMIKHDEKTIHGFVVLTIDNQEAAFINIISDINTDDLPKMGKGNWITETVLAPAGIGNEPQSTGS